MEHAALQAISPIDGRYRSSVQHLSAYFSEGALIRYRVWVEIAYLFFLTEKGFCSLNASATQRLKALQDDFDEEGALRIKALEKETNHDVKAVEYYLKEVLTECGETAAREWVHFGLTSQDINNTAVPLLWKESIEYEYLPALLNLNKQLLLLAQTWSDTPMLARTHGQPASPTILGKEISVFVERIRNSIDLMLQIPFAAKFGGATGNFNAHVAAFPKRDWISLGNEFVEEKLGLQRLQFTTQIEHYDYLAAYFDALKRINTILIDFCRDMWTYISMDYFTQRIKEGEVGSSAMPHKVNPIDFENAEGNLGIANAIFEHLSSKLPISRLQRDLTDSTVLRNIGVPFAHTILSLRSIEKGLAKLVLNNEKIERDLEDAWPVVAEAVQTILRRENYPSPYEALKKLTRGKRKLDRKTLHEFIDSLEVSSKVKAELKKITPQNYTGVQPAINE